MRKLIFVVFMLFYSPAQASVCVNLGDVTYVYDAHHFPAPGHCKPWVGFVEAGGLCPGGEKAISSGTICSSLSGDTVNGSITSTCHVGWEGQENDYVFVDNFWLFYGKPEQGGERFVVLDTGLGQSNSIFSVTLQSCDEKFGSDTVPFY